LRDAVVALQAALLGTALEALGRFAWGGPYLPELMAQKFFALIPPWAFTPLFRTFGYNSKYYAFAGMIVAEVGGLTLTGAVLRGWLRRRPLDRWGPWLAAAIAGPIAVVILVGLLPLLDAGVAGHALTGGIWVTVPTVLVMAGSYATLLTRGVSR
jgi:hypothetical protein